METKPIAVLAFPTHPPSQRTHPEIVPQLRQRLLGPWRAHRARALLSFSPGEVTKESREWRT
jgi:hypothetical protein